MLNLRDIVKSLPMLAKALQGSRSQLLQVIREMLVDERLERVEQLVGESLNDNAMAQKVRDHIAVTPRKPSDIALFPLTRAVWAL